MDCSRLALLAESIHTHEDCRTLTPVSDALAAAALRRERLLLTIDGPCGSGKSTLAGWLSRMLEAPVIHTDDFMIPMALKTPERLAIPGGNEDTERLVAECLRPWQEIGSCVCRPFDCHADCFLPSQEIKEATLLILEGSYSNLPSIRAFADVRVFLSIDPTLQLQRLRSRVGDGRLPMFISRWIPLENAYFDAYHLPDDDCITLPVRQLPDLTK